MASDRFTNDYPAHWAVLATTVKDEAGWKCVRCNEPHNPKAGYCLTVHHFDGDKANEARWNLMALCQRCHLQVQGRVDPRIPILIDPSVWAMPYIAGLYEAGRCVPSPTYDVARWIGVYEASGREWPAWAPGVAMAMNSYPGGAGRNVESCKA